ncbi:MAG: transposase [Betaproteobacteria bacterium]|nr:transposase [Betaproteobacteria bacterium]
MATTHRAQCHAERCRHRFAGHAHLAAGRHVGYDAGKKVKGAQAAPVVDTLGLLLAVTVTAASVQDRDGAPEVVAQACAKYQTIERLYADSAYAGQCAQRLEQENDIAVEVVRRPGAVGEWDHPQMPLFAEAGGFVILPKRWVVERTHAWLERERRMVMHHDRSTKTRPPGLGWPKAVCCCADWRPMFDFV